MASLIAQELNADSSTVLVTSGVRATAAGNTVTVWNNDPTVVGNYPITIDGGGGYYNFAASPVTYTPDIDMDLTCSAATNYALTGGAVAAATDAGTVTALVEGVQSSVSWGAGDNPATIASRLATAIQTNLGGAVTATPSGSTITLQSTATGAATDSAVAVSVVDTTDGITTPSFAVSAANMSGGTDAGGMTGGSPVYSYSLAGNYSPVGDVTAYADSVMGNWTFNYDKLDRLTSAAGPSSQSMAYAYDSFGNRWPTNQSHATSWSQFTTANQVPVNNGVSYDAAGNVTSLAGLHSFVYDDENRVASVDGTTSYLYDAEDNRVAKGSWSGSTFVPSAIYLLGPGNTQVAELDGSGNWKHSNVYASGKMLATYDTNGLHYQLADWLGTRRVQVSGSGSNLGHADETCTSYPFGDNLNCTGPGYDATEQHFTGKQRDSETGEANGNDYFNARYLASITGRFMTPDPSGLAFADLGNPQSLDLYSYARNNPLILIDPSGLGTFSMTCKHVPDTVTYAPGSATVTAHPDVCKWQYIPDSLVPTWGPDKKLPQLNLSGIKLPKKSLLDCASELSKQSSIAGLLESGGVGKSKVGKTVTDTLGGNVFADLVDYGRGGLKKLGGYAMMNGTHMGLGGKGVIQKGPVGAATDAAVGGAFSSVTGSGQSIQTLNGSASLASTDVTAANFADGVGEAKVAYDGGNYVVALLQCLAGI